MAALILEAESYAVFKAVMNAVLMASMLAGVVFTGILQFVQDLDSLRLLENCCGNFSCYQGTSSFLERIVVVRR